MPRNRLLIVDHDPATGLAASRVAVGLDYEALSSTEADMARNMISHWKPSHVLLDLQMPDGDGIEMLRHLAAKGSRAKILIVGGLDSDLLEAACETGRRYGLDILGALAKPIDSQDLWRILDTSRKNADPVAAGERLKQAIRRSDLKRALASGGIEAAFQPIVDLKTGRTVAVEALARWNHPKLGPVSPDTFVTLAENQGMADDLVCVMAGHATALLRRAQAAGHDLQVAINISASNLRDPRFVDRMLALFREAGCDPRNFIFELTETSAIDGSPQTLDVLSRLRLYGSGLAIDDFGTGYSSLLQLRGIPFTRVKLDRQFITNCAAEGVDLAIVHSSLNLAQRLNKKVIAEGIEDQETLDLLRLLGCDYAQGFHIAKPMTPLALLDWLAARARLEKPFLSAVEQAPAALQQRAGLAPALGAVLPAAE